MPIRVPTYEAQVGKTVPRVAQPRTPAVVPEAFGAGVARTTQQLGAVGQKISQNLLKMSVDKQDTEILQRETEYRRILQDVLNNPDTEDVVAGDQTFSRPIGLLNRTLSQAEGVTEEFDKKYYDEIKDKTLDGLSKYQHSKLLPAMSNYHEQLRNRIITHESNQSAANIKNTVESNLARKTLDASTIRDSESLSFAIGESIAGASLYNKKFDPATQQLNNEKIALDIIESSVMSTLENTGFEAANTLLESMKDKLPASTYQKFKKEFTKEAKATAERNKAAARNVFNGEQNEMQDQAARLIVENKITSTSEIDKLPIVSDEFKKVAKELVLSKDKVDAITSAVESEKLARKFDRLKLDSDGNTNKGFEELERYRIAVMMAAKNGFISKSKREAKLKQVRGAFTEDLGEIVGIKFRQGKEMRGFWRRLLGVAPLLISPVTALPTIGKEALATIRPESLTEKEQAEAMDFLDTELTKVFEKGEIPEGEVEKVALDLFEKYLKMNNPEILGLPQIPNGTVSEKESLKILKTGVNQDIKPDVSITTKPGAVLMKDSDGQLGWVPIEQKEDALKQGFTLEGK